MLPWYVWLWLTVATLLIGFAAGVFHDRDDKIMRRRERWTRKRRGYLLWWLLLPGWRYRR